MMKRENIDAVRFPEKDTRSSYDVASCADAITVEKGLTCCP